jgi:hypothetical protein
MELKCQYKPAQLQAHLQFTRANAQTENCKRVCLANAQRNSGMNNAQGTIRNIKNWSGSGKYERISNK